MNTGIASVAAITIICYLAAQGVKATALDNKWLPLICGGLGLVLGIMGRSIVPDFPAQDAITAAAVGVVSGLAATGTHQIYKQLIGGQCDEDQ
ncbi:MAG: phage holin family protein [Oscillospiraceae bacterium]|nr:phage holin family protein [Oscillospiraceae bacterium]